MDQTSRFGLPLLTAGQAQKELFHNEALLRVDALLCATVEGAPQANPPNSPAVGTCYLIAPSATGAWAGQEGAFASFTDGGWRFVAPVEGTRVLNRASGELIVMRDGSWETGILHAQEVRIGGQPVVRQRQAAIAEPTDGTVVDSECRAALVAILVAMRAHGLID